MAHGTKIDGTSYGITGGRCMVGGTQYAIKKGRTLVGGTGYDINLAAEPATVYLVRNPVNSRYAYIKINGKNALEDTNKYQPGTDGHVSLEVFVDSDYRGAENQCYIKRNGIKVVKGSGTYNENIEGKSIKVKFTDIGDEDIIYTASIDDV